MDGYVRVRFRVADGGWMVKNVRSGKCWHAEATVVPGPFTIAMRRAVADPPSGGWSPVVNSRMVSIRPGTNFYAWGTERWREGRRYEVGRVEGGWVWHLVVAPWGRERTVGLELCHEEGEVLAGVEWFNISLGEGWPGMWRWDAVKQERPEGVDWEAADLLAAAIRLGGA